MPRTLVTFLGKGRDNPLTGYRKARYRFEDTERETAFFGLALAEYLNPDHLVILGTGGSQWDLLVETVAADARREMDRMELTAAVTAGSVTQELLDRIREFLCASLKRDVLPCLIPHGKDAAEQAGILERVAETVPKGSVSFDLTHGYRHLGMVGFLSAFMLERIGKLKVEGLWYGALDMTRDGVTPVLRLDGLARLQAWIEALDRFAANGDYAVFAPLLEEDGVLRDKTDALRMAAYYESIHNVPDALRELKTFLPVLEGQLPGASGLFQKRLQERLNWVQAASLEQHQRRLAFQHLNRGDYVRAAILGWEAVITRECLRRNLNPEDYRDGRAEAEEMFESEIQQDLHEDWKRRAYWTLKNLRNALAHGVTARNGRYRELLQDPVRLRKELQACLQRLLDACP